MKTLFRVVLLCLVMPVAAVLAQDKGASDKPAQDKPAVAPDNPLSTWNKVAYTRIKDILARSAEKMPEESYSFKPADTVRTYGQIVGHLADAQYAFCALALGEKSPGLNIEKTKTTKADLIAALNAAFTYCDNAYSTMTD